MEQTREQLAWAAGFFDGEGHIGLIKTGNNRHIHMQICQTENGPLERFQKVLGRGKIYGPYTPKKTKWNQKPYKQFHLDSFEHVQYAVCLLWPWLSEPKKRQAKNVLKGFKEYLNRPKLKSGPKTNRLAQPPSCHPERKHAASGLCESCYRKNLKMRKNG